MPPPDPSPETFAREAPLVYGTWRRFKRLYKDAEAAPLAHPALFGALAARLDAAPLFGGGAAQDVEMGRDVRGLESLTVTGQRLYGLLNGSGRSKALAGYEFRPDDPLHPRLLGRVEVRNASSVVACGPFLGLLTGGLDTGALSLFEPDAPRWRGTVALGGFPRAVAASPYVYAAVQGQPNHWSGLKVVDVSDPDRPRIIGEAAIPQAQQVACDGRLAAVTSAQPGGRWNQSPNSGGLHLLDVSDPRHPHVLGALTMNNPVSVALRGTLAFVGLDRTIVGGTPTLQVVDLSDPRNPRPRGAVATAYYAPQSITLHGDVAYVASQYGPAAVVDVHDPDSPTLVETLGSYGATDIAISEGTAYVGTSYQGLHLYSVVNPRKPARIGTPPTAATLGYLKRRVRRALRRLSRTDPDGYVRLAAAVLAEARPGEHAAWDPARQWVLADLLYGHSDRFTQSRHGRGPLAETRPGRPRTRQERAPAAWDRHLDTAAALLTDPRLPWPVPDAMLKILRANRAPLPAPAPESLAGFLGSPSPLLIRYAATDVLRRLQDGEAVAPAVAGAAYAKSGVARRGALEAALGRRAGDPAWARPFVEAALRLSAPASPGAPGPRRATAVWEMAARRFPALIGDDRVRDGASALLTAGRPRLAALVLDAAGRVTPPHAAVWLTALRAADDAAREPVVARMAEALAGQDFTAAEAQELVLRGAADPGDAFSRAAGWRLLAGSATDAAVFLALWTGLLDSRAETPALRTALASPAALATLARAGLSAPDLAERLRDRPFLAGLLRPETFAAILPTVPPPVVLAVVAAIPDDRWPDFRPPLRDFLRGGPGGAAVWLAVPAALDADGTGRLEPRLLGDSLIADTLLLVDDPDILSLRHPAFDAALAGWARAHEALFTPNSSRLLQAATHVLSAVRAWALDRAGTQGFDLPFALRLRESGLPPAVAAGDAFFTSLPPGDARERAYALALCDSPLAPVRALGRTFVTDRWETLPREDLLRALFENPHPDMQAFVAALLARAPARPAETARFDAAVLRARHTARRAKEQIKARQTAEPTVDVPTLLALARSRTPRDAEWALAELARRALAGEEIEGLTIGGVAGGSDGRHPGTG